MALIPWRTKNDLSNRQSSAGGGEFRNEVDRLFDSFMRDTLGLGERVGGWGLPVDVAEGDKEINVRAEIPGVKVDDLQLSIRGDVLVIAGEKKESEDRREGDYVYQERRFGSFRREVPLPAAVESDDVTAEYKDGILTVQLKKSQEALPKKISVKAS